jgi:hypothetical protein
MNKRSLKKWLYFSLMLVAASVLDAASVSANDAILPVPLEAYSSIEAEKAIELGIDPEALGLIEIIKLRAEAEPLNLVTLLLFLGAIIHTFAAGWFLKLSKKYEKIHDNRLREELQRNYVEDKSPVDFRATLFHFLGEVEVIFGIWVLPLLLALTLFKGWPAAYNYIDGRNYTEPLFVVVIMAIAASRPVVFFAGNLLRRVARLGKLRPSAWWLSILTVAPLLGSLITEPAAMTIAAMLLGREFYRYRPTERFKYATLGLLFVNISVGGTLTHFAAPPVLMVAAVWEWNLPFVFVHLGVRSMVGILLATTAYYFVFRKEFEVIDMTKKAVDSKVTVVKNTEPVPPWVVAIHLSFLGWTVFTLHHPALFIGGFLFFLAFTIATDHHQYAISLKSPLLVGFFLAGLVTHGGLQSWWISPILSSLSEMPLFFGSMLLTAFNDNAAITFLASQVPAFDPNLALDSVRSARLQQAVVAGAVTGGGLTVIANAPNPAGQNLLSRYFGGNVSPLRLLAGAALPTIVMVAVFSLVPH